MPRKNSGVGLGRFGTTNDSKDTNGCDVGVSSGPWFVVRGWRVAGGGWRGLGMGLRLRFRPAGLVSGSPGCGAGCGAAMQRRKTRTNTGFRG